MLAIGTQSRTLITLNHALPCLTTDVMSAFLFGQTITPSCISTGLSDPTFSHPIVMILPPGLLILVVKAHFYTARFFFNYILPLLLTTFNLGDAGVARFTTLVRQQVDGYIADPQRLENVKHRVIFGSLMDPRNKLSKQTILDEATTLLFSGSDTVGTVLSVGLPMIYLRPEVLRRLREEVDSVWGSKAAPAYEKLERIPYLTATVKEVFRFNPGTTAPIWRDCIKEGGAEVAGVWVPKGMQVGMANRFVNFAEGVWGDPEVFRPERWLGDEGKTKEKWLSTFSRGHRLCLGIK